MERRCGCIVGKVCSGDESFKLGVMVMVGDGVGIGVGSHQSSGEGKGAGSHHWSDVDVCCLTGVLVCLCWRLLWLQVVVVFCNRGNSCCC